MWYANANQGLASKRWLHADHLGSIVAQTATDGSGGNPGINRYDEYGVPAPTNGGRFQYTGHVWIGPLGLYYNKARLYSPTLGRFLQTDPVGYEGGVNLYAYVEGDPVNAIDFEGQQLESVMDRRNQALVQAMEDCEGKGAECAAAIGQGIGVTATAASFVVAPELLVFKALPWFGRAFGLGFKGFSPAFREALVPSGRHFGFLRNYINKSVGELQRGIRRFERRIAEHEAKLADPAGHVKKDWSKMDPREQQGVLKGLARRHRQAKGTAGYSQGSC